MRNALVVIDMQIGFINEHTEMLENKIANFIDKYKEHFHSIIGTRYINHTETACYKFEGYTKCMRGSVEAYTSPKLASKYTFSFSKDKYSCWTDKLKMYIRENKIDRLYFVGVNTGCCVLHSAFDAYNDVMNCYVISDLCGSTSGEQSHKVALQVLRECITSERVIESKEFMNTLGG